MQTNANPNLHSVKSGATQPGFFARHPVATNRVEGAACAVLIYGAVKGGFWAGKKISGWWSKRGEDKKADAKTDAK